jgi:hypothetical protein
MFHEGVFTEMATTTRVDSLNSTEMATITRGDSLNSTKMATTTRGDSLLYRDGNHY